MKSQNGRSQPVAMVTGATSGIGHAAARTLAEAGYAVVGTGRDVTTVTPLRDVKFIDLDVTQDESVTHAVSQTLKKFGRIDLLVNNAGAGLIGAAEESSIDQVKALFETNLFGAIRMTNAVLPHMRAESSGRIVNISSILGLIPAPYMALYAATKHALEGYTESLDHELREHGIRALLIEPGYTRTSFEANTPTSDRPITTYAQQSRVAREILAGAMINADAPPVVGKAILTAAQDPRPKLRYPVGATARRVSLLRRLVPSRAFDKQLRKLNRLE